jgi:hypothetical protein
LAGRGLRSYNTNEYDGNLRVSIAFAHAYGVPNSYGNIHAYGDCYSDVYSYANSYGYPYAYCDTYGNCNGHIHADSYSNCNGDSYGYGYGYSYSYSYSYSYGNTNGDRTAKAHADAEASAYTGTSSLVLSGIKGTRDNELASSQPDVDRFVLKAMANYSLKAQVYQAAKPLLFPNALRSRREDRSTLDASPHSEKRLVVSVFRSIPAIRGSNLA